MDNKKLFEEINDIRRRAGLSPYNVNEGFGDLVDKVSGGSNWKKEFRLFIALNAHDDWLKWNSHRGAGEVYSYIEKVGYKNRQSNEFKSPAIAGFYAMVRLAERLRKENSINSADYWDIGKNLAWAEETVNRTSTQHDVKLPEFWRGAAEESEESWESGRDHKELMR